ncbi:unnamed protein product, partial [Medioppia subpectinata]
MLGYRSRYRCEYSKSIGIQGSDYVTYAKTITEEVISDLKGKFDYRKEYSPDLRQIYSQYLKDNPFLKECPKQEGKASEISAHDMEEAVKRATKLMVEYKKIDDNYINANPNVKQFNQTVYESNLKTKFNEFVSQELSKIKCLNKLETTIGLLSIKAPDIVTQNGDFCEMSQNVSLKVKTLGSKFMAAIDGKCNHLRQTNWGAAFRCQRRLLPANFADGVNKIPVASDGSPLPNERFISNKLLKQPWCDPDQTLSSMQMIWGQLMAHDVIKTIQYMGFGLRCCPTTGAPHSECVLINDIPQDRLTMAFSNQTCMSFARSIACNACQLGPRNEESLSIQMVDQWCSPSFRPYTPKRSQSAAECRPVLTVDELTTQLRAAISERKRISGTQVLTIGDNVVEYYLANQSDPPLMLRTEFISEDIGVGVFATQVIPKHTFICEYDGQLMDAQQAKVWEVFHALRAEGCYMYYFTHKSKRWCLDATAPTARFGRLLNHSRKHPNVKAVAVEYEGRPYVVLKTLREINVDEELRYDYGERDPAVIAAKPWLNTS